MSATAHNNANRGLRNMLDRDLSALARQSGDDRPPPRMLPATPARARTVALDRDLAAGKARTTPRGPAQCFRGEDDTIADAIRATLINVDQPLFQC
jgi:hypothetical protein